MTVFEKTVMAYKIRMTSPSGQLRGVARARRAYRLAEFGWLAKHFEIRRRRVRTQLHIFHFPNQCRIIGFCGDK